MAITINSNGIYFDRFSIRRTVEGFTINGTLASAGRDFNLTPLQISNTNGYVVGGFNHTTTIERYPFASSTSGSSVGSIASTEQNGGTSSINHGYVFSNSSYTTPFRKYSFSASTPISATVVGSLTQAVAQAYGAASPTDGYVLGGRRNSPPFSTSNIEKFPFATDNNTTVTAFLQAATSDTSGMSGQGFIYTAGVYTSTRTISRFPYISEVPAQAIGNLTPQMGSGGFGASAPDMGYVAGGWGSPPQYSDNIDRFPFASEANGVAVGSLSLGRRQSAASNSTTHGYCAGGYAGGGIGRNIIDRYPFASSAPASNIGSLTSPTMYAAGNQN